MVRTNPAKTTYPLGIGVIRQKITYAFEDVVKDAKQKLPAYASVIGGGVHVKTAFNDSGTDTLDVGFRDGSSTDDDNAYATTLDLSAVGYIALDELVATSNVIQTKECFVTWRYNGQNNNASAGEAYHVILYVEGFAVYP